MAEWLATKPRFSAEGGDGDDLFSATSAGLLLPDDAVLSYSGTIDFGDPADYYSSTGGSTFGYRFWTFVHTLPEAFARLNLPQSCPLLIVRREFEHI